MTTYISFAEAVSLGGSTTGVEESKEIDEVLPQMLPPSSPSGSSTIWDGLDCDTTGGSINRGSFSREVRVALSPVDSASLGVVKGAGAKNEELGAFPTFLISSEMAITVAADGISCGDECSLASNSPSVGAASILTLDTALQSLQGLALVEDDAFLMASSLCLPPPPPPPGLPPPSVLPQESGHSSEWSERRTSSYIAPDPKEEYVPSLSPGLLEEGDGDEAGCVEEAVGVKDRIFIHRGTGPESQMANGEDKGTMTEDASNCNYREQSSMTDKAPELEDKGIMTEDVPIDLVERKVASLCTCINQLLADIDRLAVETAATLPGNEGCGVVSLEVLEIDPLSPPSLEDITTHIEELSKVVSSSASTWNTRLQRSTLQSQSFRKEQRRWRRENGRLRDEIRHLKMQAAESASQNNSYASANALKEENERLRDELDRMRQEACGAFPSDKLSAIALATSIYRGPQTCRRSSL
jgi:hypothetical protein